MTFIYKKIQKYVSKNISYSIKGSYYISSSIFCIYDIIYIDFRFAIIVSVYEF